LKNTAVVSAFHQEYVSCVLGGGQQCLWRRGEPLPFQQCHCGPKSKG